jgi:hypothetical protein
VPQVSEFISIRLDGELKAELCQAAELERRSLSNFCRLLVEYAWGEYLRAGSMSNLLDRAPNTAIGVTNGRSSRSGNQAS